jgi:nitroimidazol reductase NimA-like FMN-containing flavoprotein (pyridoxamine 5'-phosphate oxidase superfamily)
MEKMRRSDRQMSEEKAIKVLSDAVYGILSTVGEDGYPYGVPVNFALVNNRLYFHCAVEGKKLRNIAFNPKVSFVAMGENEVLAEQFSMSYESVMAFGKASEVIDVEEKVQVLMLLVKKYSKSFEMPGETYARRAVDKTRIYEIEIEHMSGKERLK